MTKPQKSKPSIAAISEELKLTRAAYHLAAEMSQFKAGFLARISHELRSPLNSLIGLHQLIISDLCESPEEEREFIEQAHASALKLVGLIDEVLNVSRTEYGTNRLDIQPLQLAEVLSQVYDLTHLQAANRNHRLTIETPSPDIFVLADPRWLRQVLLNLVDTPLKYMEPINVQVSVHLDPATEYVNIWVEDERPAEALTEPIDLLKTISEDKEPLPVNEDFTLSPGLSLMMSQTILELMKGRLEVIAVPSDEENSKFTNIQCSIPLCTKEVFDTES
ncbi:sensor histidine kinase [[Phormidium] sp. LEGE 05292]|uniref:sensor histidine kinase n=1 Tax=[Phormidium] sp. LEGE 05292 TaxID=767427 RepID=UPI001D1383FF|nr:HAMP domain-containing sensor histidine kinase [Phormidium sp. LEGE 05292]